MMDRETVEANDQKFCQKLEGLRTSLAGRQQTHRKKRSANLGIKVLAPLVVVAAVAGFYLKGNTLVTEPPTAPVEAVKPARPAAAPPSSFDAKAPAAPVEKAAASNPASSAAEGSPVAAAIHAGQGKTTSAADRDAAPLAAATASRPPTAPPVSAGALAPSPKSGPGGAAETIAAAPAASLKAASQAIPTTTAAFSEAVEGPAATAQIATVPLNHIRITKKKACTGVEARECVDTQTDFALSQTETPHVWMEVHSRTLPYVLKHVYYHEGRRYVEVPLAIKHPRMRTWSKVTPQGPRHEGAWRVEIATQDGTVLDEVSFRVAP